MVHGFDCVCMFGFYKRKMMMVLNLLTFDLVFIIAARIQNVDQRCPDIIDSF